MYVELLGLPASGKTTVLTQIKSIASLQGRKVANIAQIDLMDKTAKGIPGFVSKRSATRAILRAEEFREVYTTTSLICSEVFRDNLTFRSLFVATGARYMAYRAQPNIFDYFVLDEGFVHRMIHGLMRYEHEKYLLFSEFLATLPPIDIIVFLEIDPKTCFDRAVVRLAKRLGEKVPLKTVEKSILNFHGSLESLKIRQDLMRQACEALETNGTRIIKIDTSLPLNENNDFISASLSSLF